MHIRAARARARAALLLLARDNKYDARRWTFASKLTFWIIELRAARAIRDFTTDARGAARRGVARPGARSRFSPRSLRAERVTCRRVRRGEKKKEQRVVTHTMARTITFRVFERFFRPFAHARQEGPLCVASTTNLVRTDVTPIEQITCRRDDGIVVDAVVRLIAIIQSSDNTLR